MGVEDWSLDPDENTDINGTDISEGCPARNVNDAIREIMAAVKETFDDMAEVADEALFPDWSAGTDYGVHRFVRGADGKLYQSKAASGPSGTAGAQNPVEDATHAYWAPMPEDDDSVVHKSGSETVTGQKTFSSDIVGNAQTASGVRVWSSSKDYGQHELVLGSDGCLYMSLAASGPSETAGAVDPTTDDGTCWASPRVPAPASDSSQQAAPVSHVMPRTGGNFSGEITVQGEDVIHIPNTAAARNCFYRGKDLTSVFTLDDLHNKMLEADFSGLCIGDYLTKPVSINYSGSLDGETITASFSGDMNFRIAHFDYWLGMGDTPMDSHHIVFVPDKPFFNVKMRKTNTTAGGVPASNVWKILQNQLYTAINATTCMNGKILTHRDWIPDSVNTNAASAAGAGFTGSTVWTSTMWRDVKLGMLHEPMVYGGTHFSSSGYDTGCGKSQLALFQLEPTWIHCGSNRNHYWLCAVSSASFFAYAGGGGYADSYYASDTNVGVRPFFLIG